MAADASDGVWNIDGCKASATPESTLADASGGVWNLDGSKSDTIVESILADASDICVKSNNAPPSYIFIRNYIGTKIIHPVGSNNPPVTARIVNHIIRLRFTFKGRERINLGFLTEDGAFESNGFVRIIQRTDTSV